MWGGDQSLKVAFPKLFSIVSFKDASVTNFETLILLEQRMQGGGLLYLILQFDLLL
jgi:hypothetical protein